VGGQDLNIEDITRVLRLLAAVAQERRLPASCLIDDIEEFLRPRSATSDRLDSLTVAFIERMRRIRLRRNSLVEASIFRDPAWDMLLELYAADHKGKQLSVSSLSYGSGVPLSTALRQLNRLESHGLITRSGDRSDNRRSIAQPTDKARAVVATTVRDLIDNFQSLQHLSRTSG
jgi:DNA-binding MarR family transcriptional regulator